MDEADLLRRLRLKDEEAFNELVQAYGPRLLRAARLITGNNQYAEELASDVFAEAYLALPRYRAESSLFNWLYAIMLNQFRYRLRQKKRFVPLTSEIVSIDNQPEHPEKTDFVNNISNWLSLVSPEHRDVLILKYLEQKKIDEIADILGIPVGTVKSRIHNALESLRKIIKDMNLLPDSVTN
ncbi:MAG: RNA polymerase sigma factor [Planctomycetota bacterium]